MSENGEWKHGNEWGCEQGRLWERVGKTEVSIALILSQLFLPYQASPDLGEKHVPTMHSGSCPSAWNEPLTPSYQLRGWLPVPVALHLCIQGKLVCRALSHTQSNMHKDTCMPQTQPSAIWSWVQVTSPSASLSKLAVQTWDKYTHLHKHKYKVVQSHTCKNVPKRADHDPVLLFNSMKLNPMPNKTHLLFFFFN